MINISVGFEWDEEKAKSNLVKHGVSFKEASFVFNDAFFVETPDDKCDYGEERTLIVGMSRNRLLAVVYTERSGKIRIISARKVTKNERDDYYSQNVS